MASSSRTTICFRVSYAPHVLDSSVSSEVLLQFFVSSFFFFPSSCFPVLLIAAFWELSRWTAEAVEVA